jgi:predicted transcriptional regulator
MATPSLAIILARAANWPAEALAELLSYAEEIEMGLDAGIYHPTKAELASIDRGLADARAGRFATDEQVAAVFARRRRA